MPRAHTLNLNATGFRHGPTSCLRGAGGQDCRREPRPPCSDACRLSSRTTALSHAHCRRPCSRGRRQPFGRVRHIKVVRHRRRRGRKRSCRQEHRPVTHDWPPGRRHRSRNRRQLPPPVRHQLMARLHRGHDGFAVGGTGDVDVSPRRVGRAASIRGSSRSPSRSASPATRLT